MSENILLLDIAVDKKSRFYVKARRDVEAGVWYVADTDIPGLVADADTPEELETKIVAITNDLVELNPRLFSGNAA